MKNIPRIFIPGTINTGDVCPVDKSVIHYLTHVMRTDKCLVFGEGNEFSANVASDKKSIIVGEKTEHNDPSNNIALYFAPIKKLDDMLNMATQMGVSEFHPVITERVVAHHINWDRMQKIVTEAAEQSNRNSVPKIFKPIKFIDLPTTGICFADERRAYNDVKQNNIPDGICAVFIGPEGGFSDSEFTALDALGIPGISLGKTILRAEVAAVIAIEKLIK